MEEQEDIWIQLKIHNCLSNQLELTPGQQDITRLIEEWEKDVCFISVNKTKMKAEPGTCKVFWFEEKLFFNILLEFNQ